MIEITNLTKRYGSIKAVDNISFTVQPGEIVGFLGPNGAGKTTTMNILTGYIPSTSGVVKVGGYDVMEDPEKVKKQIGYLPEQPPLFYDLTVLEYLMFAAELKKVQKTLRRQQVAEAMELMRIGDHRNRLIKNLSKGYKQRVGFAQALLGEPEVLILDEPTVGLDPQQIIEMRTLIKALGKKHTIILSSHILQEVSAVCERVIIITRGRIVAIDTPENLSKGMADASRLSVTVAGEQAAVVSAASEIYGVKNIEKLGDREQDAINYLVESDRDVDIRRPLFFAMANIGCPILEMRSMDMSLEEIFLELVAGVDVAAGGAPGDGAQGDTDAGGAQGDDGWQNSVLEGSAQGDADVDGAQTDTMAGDGAQGDTAEGGMPGDGAQEGE